MSNRQQKATAISLPNGDSLQVYMSYADRVGTDAVLYLHGFGSTRQGEKAQALEEACVRRGWTFVAFDFRGHGLSSGTLLDLRGSGLLADIDAVRAFLREKGINRCFPVGSSMGGWAAAWFTIAATECVPATVLIAPALNFLQSRWAGLSPDERDRWKTTGRLRVKNQWVDAEIGYGIVEEIEEYQVEILAARWRKPLLIFHGIEDDVLPFADSVAFVQTVQHPDVELRLFKAGDHRLVPFKDAMAEAACVFFERWR